jgi:hypothetical protein
MGCHRNTAETGRGCRSVAERDLLFGGRDAGGVHPVRLARCRPGALFGEGGALLQGGAMECERGGEAERVALAAADGLGCDLVLAGQGLTAVPSR